ncbi:MAG TPA: CADD family putative folate metabolism protein [Bdellovibrionota bacterium]|nr:CADD family putative folate metabolism protein [Bdellovibrionota bacterium]
MHPLDKVISKRHLLKHPFYQRWVDGRLTMNELRAYAANYYPHVLAFPTYVSAVHSRCEDIKQRQALLENLIEEERGEENHPELWLRFAEAVGATREEVNRTSPIAESHELVETFRRLTRESFASGLGALYAYESQVPDIAQQKISGLEKFYGVENARGLKFFAVHQEADQWHSATAREAIDRLSDVEKEQALEAARTASEALWNFLSGLDRANGVDSRGCASAA